MNELSPVAWILPSEWRAVQRLESGATAADGAEFARGLWATALLLTVPQLRASRGIGQRALSWVAHRDSIPVKARERASEAYAQATELAKTASNGGLEPDASLMLCAHGFELSRWRLLLHEWMQSVLRGGVAAISGGAAERFDNLVHCLESLGELEHDLAAHIHALRGPTREALLRPLPPTSDELSAPRAMLKGAAPRGRPRSPWYLAAFAPLEQRSALDPLATAPEMAGYAPERLRAKPLRFSGGYTLSVFTDDEGVRAELAGPWRDGLVLCWLAGSETLHPGRRDVGYAERTLERDVSGANANALPIELLQPGRLLSIALRVGDEYLVSEDEVRG